MSFRVLWYTNSMVYRPLIPVSTWTAPVVARRLTLYSPNIRSLVHRLRTPLQVQAWLRSLQYNKEKTMHTLPGVVRRGRVHCLEGALCAAAILEHQGYPPLILDLESADLLDHTLFLYRQNGRFGSVGKSRDVGLDGRKPVFRTVEALVRSYAAPYIDANACLTGFGVLDLRALTRSHWRTSANSVWYVESALHRLRHQKLRLSSEFVCSWRQKYVAWQRAHPGQQPTFYPNQHCWL